MKCYFDLESTNLSVYEAEAIEIYFVLENGEDYHFKSQVDKWNYDAELIHKIPEHKMLTYPDKKTAYRNLLIWIDQFNITELVCFANPNTMHGFIHYDVGVIKVQLDELSGTHTLFYKYFCDNVTSVHTMAKKASRERLFIPIKKKSETGRMMDSFTQENVFLALFGHSYDNAHNAKIDVTMMMKIYDRLIYLSNSNRVLI